MFYVLYMYGMYEEELIRIEDLWYFEYKTMTTLFLIQNAALPV